MLLNALFRDRGMMPSYYLSIYFKPVKGTAGTSKRNSPGTRSHNHILT